jgi:hypothetical protein
MPSRRASRALLVRAAQAFWAPVAAVSGGGILARLLVGASVRQRAEI